MVKISVIMPVYNAAEYLEMACSSVEKQTLKDIELICIDIGSTDDTLNLLNELKEKHKFIKIFTRKNQGIGKARNYGMSKSQGKYIAFLDSSDIFLDESALEKMYFYGIKNNADIVCSNLKKILKNGKIDSDYDFKNTKFNYFNKKDIILPIEYGIPSAFYKNIFKRKFLEKYNILFPDLITGQDPVFLAKALVNSDELYVLRADLYGYNHSVHGDVNTNVDSFEKKLDYIKHFKFTFDLLKENMFDEPFETYKREFIDYLLFKNNLYDEEIGRAVREVFSDNVSEYFIPKDYGYSYLDMILNDDDINSYDSFGDLKGHLVKETLLTDNFIEIDSLRTYVKIINENKNNKSLLEKISINKVKEMENEINEDYEFLSNNINSISDEFNLITVNNKVKMAEKDDSVMKEIDNDPDNTNSFIINKFLKTIKHFYKD